MQTALVYAKNGKPVIFQMLLDSHCHRPHWSAQTMVLDNGKLECEIMWKGTYFQPVVIYVAGKGE